MDNQVNSSGLDKENTLGFDNADILAEKRRRSVSASTKSASVVSADALRAQMQSGYQKSQSGSGAVNKTQNVSQSRVVSSAGSTTGNGSQPAAPARSQTSSVKSVKPKQTSQASSAVKPKAGQGSSSAFNADKVRLSSPPTVRPDAPKSTTASKPSMIPFKQVSLKKNLGADEGATRITDIRDIRAVADSANDSTRLTDVNRIAPPPKKNVPPQEQDESEGENTIISLIKAITYIVAVIVVSVFLSTFIILVGNDVFAFVKDDTLVEVTIPEYATVNDIATVLYDNSVIEYPSIFKIYAQLNGSGDESESQFVAGTYTVHPMMNYDELLYAFKKKAPSGISRITIPEGYTTDEIIDLFVSYNIGTREKYVDVINNYDFDYWFIDELEASGVSEDRFYRLDGYLFPDTYEFYNASSEEVVIDKLLRRFNQVFLDSYAQKAKELGFTVDEILIIASMIEKEAGTQADFFDISSVFNNRLNAPAKYPYLESDATVVYAIHHDTGNRVTPTDQDMVYESPYNTYTNKGLPPGPIANPSASAIRAALYPSDTDYYFFYSESASITHYSKTYEEHRKVIAEVQNKNNSAN